jgi:hypothetical protein
VGTAIANAESRAELACSEARAHDLAREQAALHRVGALVAEGATACDVFAAVAQEVADVIAIPVVGLCRFEADDTFGRWVPGPEGPKVPSVYSRSCRTGRNVRNRGGLCRGRRMFARGVRIPGARARPVWPPGVLWQPV